FRADQLGTRRLQRAEGIAHVRLGGERDGCSGNRARDQTCDARHQTKTRHGIAPYGRSARDTPGAGNSIIALSAPGMSYLPAARLAAQVTALSDAVTMLESIPTPHSTRPSAVSASM